MTEHHPEETIAVVASELDCPELSDELVDELLAGARTPEEITGPEGLLQRLTKRLVERAMAAELTDHLGYVHGQAPPGGAGNARNGTTPKTVHTGHGSVRIEQPRDRRGSFEPMDPRARAYVARRCAEGRSNREATRALKRHLSDAIYRQLRADAILTSQTTPDTEPRRA